MPKKQKVRETSNPLGLKINQVMEEKHMAGDYAALAKIFDVATTSTYDWVTHGRLAKERYQKLVEWSGKSLDWWFDIAPAAALYERAGASPAIQINETVKQMPEKRVNQWPFSVPVEKVQALDYDDIMMLDSYIKGVVDTRLNDARKRS